MGTQSSSNSSNYNSSSSSSPRLADALAAAPAPAPFTTVWATAPFHRGRDSNQSIYPRCSQQSGELKKKKKKKKNLSRRNFQCSHFSFRFRCWSARFRDAAMARNIGHHLVYASHYKARPRRGAHEEKAAVKSGVATSYGPPI
jgi:hypothetical protein